MQAWPWLDSRFVVSTDGQGEHFITTFKCHDSSVQICSASTCCLPLHSEQDFRRADLSPSVCFSLGSDTCACGTCDSTALQTIQQTRARAGQPKQCHSHLSLVPGHAFSIRRYQVRQSSARGLFCVLCIETLSASWSRLHNRHGQMLR